MPLCHFDSYNLWILKPTHLNRGRGIHVFRDPESLHKLIKQYCSGRTVDNYKAKHKEKATQDVPEPAQESTDEAGGEESKPSENAVEGLLQSSPNKKSKPFDSGANKIKFNTFVIQKYIEKPLLIHKRKFDIRVWVTLTQDQDLYFFPEGYLRTSGSEFSIDLKNVDDAFVHLTNNAVQKNSSSYGQFEDGNQLSFERFQQYIDEHYVDHKISVKNDLVPQMEEIVIKTFNAVRRSIDPLHRKHCFELFGYDFILDEDFNMFLIEVNTNPCIEESSNILKVYIPRMLEDMLKLTVDVLFPKSGLRRNRKNTNKKESPVKKDTKFTETGVSPPLKRIATKLDIIGEEN